MLSIVTDMRYEASMTAAQNHCHRASVPVARTHMQRSRTYDTFTEAYLSSEKQEEVRRAQAWNLKSRMEFTMNSRNPRLSHNLSMEVTRGIRGAESTSLRDGTPNTAYVVEWV